MTQKIIKIITIAILFVVGTQLAYCETYAIETVDGIVQRRRKLFKRGRRHNTRGK